MDIVTTSQQQQVVEEKKARVQVVQHRSLKYRRRTINHTSCYNRT